MNLFTLRLLENVVVIGLMLLTKAGFSEMNKSVIADVLSPQDIGTATLLQTVIEDIELSVFALFL